MAIVLGNKAKNIGSEIVQHSEKLMQAIEGLIALEAERSTAGVTLADHDAVYADAGGLQHATGADYQAALTSAAALKAWLDANFHSGNFNRVRP